MTEQSKFFEGLLQQETFFLESQDGFGLKYNIPNFFICFGLPSVILSQWMMISYLALLLIIPCHSLTVCHLMRRRLPRKLVEIHIKFKREFSNCPKQQKTRPIDKYSILYLPIPTYSTSFPFVIMASCVILPKASQSSVHCCQRKTCLQSVVLSFPLIYLYEHILHHS